MAGEVWEYVSLATADYFATEFDISPQQVMTEYGGFRQRVVQYDDSSVQVITKSDTPEIYFRCSWPALTEVDANTIFDFYFDTAKAKGKARTFEFPHPIDGVTYIVRFWSFIEKAIKHHRGIAEITLRVEGYTES